MAESLVRSMIATAGVAVLAMAGLGSGFPATRAAPGPDQQPTPTAPSEPSPVPQPTAPTVANEVPQPTAPTSESFSDDATPEATVEPTVAAGDGGLFPNDGAGRSAGAGEPRLPGEPSQPVRPGES